MRVGSAKTAHDGLDLILESALQFALQGAVEQALALAYGQGRAAEQCVGEALYLGVQRVRIDQAVEQSHRSGGRGIEEVCREDDLPRQTLSDEVWQQHARAARDHHAHARLDAPHAHSRRGKAKIAGQGQFEPTADRVAIDGRDGRLLTHEQAGEALQVQNERQEFIAGLLFGLLQIIAGAEVRSRAAQDNQRGLGIVLGAFQGRCAVP